MYESPRTSSFDCQAVVSAGFASEAMDDCLKGLARRRRDAMSRGALVVLALAFASAPAVAQTLTTIQPSPVSLTVGQAVALTGLDMRGQPVSGVKWSSDSSSIATVDKTGTVTGKAAGQTAVVAQVKNVKVTAVVTVTDPAPTSAVPAPSNSPAPTPPRESRGIWISRSEVAEYATWGTAWEKVLQDARSDFGVANIADQHSKHDSYTMAAALVCVRTGEACDKARAGILDAIGTEAGSNWLAVGRNLTSYIIAADLLELRPDADPDSVGSQVGTWLRGWLTKTLADNITGSPRRFSPFHSGSNAAAQEGAAFAALAAYLNDASALGYAWDTFRKFTCDPAAPLTLAIDLNQGVAAGWAHDDWQPCAINPIGTYKYTAIGDSPGVHRIDGALINDMRRGGSYQMLPVRTQYPWTGLAGVVPAAVILKRAGYPAFEVADNAVLRAHEYLWWLRTHTGDDAWFDSIRGSEVVQLVNYYYGTTFPVRHPVSVGHTVGYTDWTHPTTW